MFKIGLFVVCIAIISNTGRLQADDIPTSKDNKRAPTNLELAVRVVDVGNDEPWLEIAIHEHDSKREASALPRPKTGTLLPNSTEGKNLRTKC